MPIDHRASTIVVLAKQPRPGFVKTRLMPRFTAHEAADLAGAALLDTLAAADLAGYGRRVLSFEGSPLGWLPQHWELHVQPAGGLDERIVAALEVAVPGPAVLIGMDTPQVTPALLAAFDPASFDACIGFTADGGYWSIGYRDVSEAARTVRGVPMSEPTTGECQYRRLLERGLRVQVLPSLDDVDTADVARQVAGAAPHTAFAQTLLSIDAAGVR